MRPRRRRAAALAAATLFACLGGAFALAPAPVPEASGFALDLAELRARADEPAGARPSVVRAAVIAESSKPAFGVLGGLRFDRLVFLWTAFQIVYADGSTILVDAPGDASQHARSSQGDAFHDAAYVALQRAARRATWIVITHEHPDHAGGLARSPHWEELRGRVRFTRAQLASRALLTRSAGFTREQLAALAPLDAGSLHPIAPGVVLVRAPGHTPGSQLVYVRLEAGGELLLAGDVAWHRDHVRVPRGHPRVSSWLLGEDGTAVGAQLRALHALERAGVHVVASHDAETVRALVAAGVLGSGLE